MRTNYDRKLAASGERDDDATVALTPVKSLVAALKSSQATQPTEKNKQPVKTPSEESIKISGERRTVEITYYPLRDQLDEMMRRHGHMWVRYMSEHARDDRQIVAAFGRSQPTPDRLMSWGVVDSYLLNGENLTQPFNYMGEQDKLLLSKRLHPLAREFTVKRQDLIREDGNRFTGVVMEVGFWSRLIKKDPADPDEDLRYIGKMKLYFPQPYSTMVFYIDLSHTK